jgi:transposase
MDLTDVQWAVLEPTFRPRRRLDGRGRPWTDSRAVMNGVLWVLRTGAPWHDLPSRYPPYQTCHRRFQLWQRSGRLDRLAVLAVREVLGGFQWFVVVRRPEPLEVLWNPR